MSIKRVQAAGLAFLLGAGGAMAAAWNSSFDTAKSQAAASSRPILMNFTGSDWCPACQRLRATVLDTPEFRKYADEKLVLMEVDFPRYRPLALLHQQANRQLATKYRITAFPTLILVNADGSPIAQLQGSGSAAQMVAALDQRLSRGQPGNGQPFNGRRRPSDFPPEPVRDLPLFGGAATRPPPVYTNLVVKSISGSASKRFALINSETMTRGDSTWLKVGDKKVEVHCVDVREKSVVVRVNGERTARELPLASR